MCVFLESLSPCSSSRVPDNRRPFYQILHRLCMEIPWISAIGFVLVFPQWRTLFFVSISNGAQVRNSNYTKSTHSCLVNHNRYKYQYVIFSHCVIQVLRTVCGIHPSEIIHMYNKNSILQFSKIFFGHSIRDTYVRICNACNLF